MLPESFIVEFDITNAAFVENPGEEIAQILRNLADLVERESFASIGRFKSIVWDSNGNKIGAAEVIS